MHVCASECVQLIRKIPSLKGTGEMCTSPCKAQCRIWGVSTMSTTVVKKEQKDQRVARRL